MLHRWLNARILLPDKYCYQVPADLGLVAHDVTFANAQGQPLRGLWFAPVSQPDVALPPATAAPVVLVCPGTSGNLSSHLYYIELLCRAGCWVLGFDYTGFGQSAGQASLHTLVADVLCASDFLQREHHLTAFGLFGMSLGANLALQVAAQRPDIRAVAVEGLALYREITRGILKDGIMGPRSITSIAYPHRPPTPREHHVVNSRHVSAWLANLLSYLGTAWFPFTGKDPLVPARLLTNTPVFCIHGLDDQLLPFEATLRVYDTLPGPKQLWLIPEVSHAQEPVLAMDGEYVAQLAYFFHTTLQASPSSALSSLTSELIPQGAHQYILRLRNGGQPCVVFTTVVTEHRLACHYVWLEDSVDIPVMATDPQPRVYCLRLLETNGASDNPQIRSTPRGHHYRTTLQPLLRALSQSLHEGRWHELAALVPTLPHARPEPPLDFFLGVYCVQIMQRTRRISPHLAQAAARAFTRYWHYGPPPEQSGAASLWDLTSEILGQPGHPHRSVSARP